MRRDLVLIAIIVSGFTAATIMAIAGQVVISFVALFFTFLAILVV